MGTGVVVSVGCARVGRLVLPLEALDGEVVKVRTEVVAFAAGGGEFVGGWQLGGGTGVVAVPWLITVLCLRSTIQVETRSIVAGLAVVCVVWVAR